MSHGTGSSKRDYKSYSKNALIDRIIQLEVLLEQQMAAAPGAGNEVTVQGIVSFEKREPLVDMRAGEVRWQFTPAMARQQALLLLDAAVESERDAATIAFCMETMNFDFHNAGAFLAEMREHRQDWFKEFVSMSSVRAERVRVEGPETDSE